MAISSRPTAVKVATNCTTTLTMGCTSSRDLTPPKTPLEVIVYEEARQGQLQRLQRQEEKQIEKLRKKLERKRKKQLKKSRKNSRLSTTSSRRRTTNAMDMHKNEASKLKDLDAEIEEETHALINTDLCMFLLNQIAFSSEFFGNFERESTSILAEFLNKENEFNKNLVDQSILLANPLDAAVQKWIKFKPFHGADKSRAQPLQAPVIYVVFENIDISRPDDSNYDSIPPLCSVIMETKSYRTTPCKEELIDVLRQIQWKGYVRLKLRENPKEKQADETKESKKKFKNSRTGKSEIYGTNFVGQASSGYGTEQDYDYAYITKLNTQKPLAELKMEGSKKVRHLGANVLPDSCISYLGDYLDARLIEDSDDDMYELKEDGNYNLDLDVEKRMKPFRNMEALQAIRRYRLEVERRRTLLQQQYINSQKFMAYFAELMRQSLLRQLSIEDEDLATATYRGASIYTKDYEIIPAIHVAQNAQHWPECTAQFRLRERPIRVHPRGGESVQWPTRAMIKQIETFGYHVIPLGYAPKRRKNPFRELEWRIVFPKAERYLERHLTWTQVKIFMIMKTLIKTFIEPKEPGKRLMFVMELLRTHLFWECERNFTIWPEEFLGDVLLRFIDTFKSSLKQKRLRDYFIQERNLLDGIPEHSILTLVSILADIASNPLMHVLVAFRNLDFNEKFFPKLDFKKIFKNLTAENLPKLKQLSKNSNFFADSDNGSDGDEHGFEVVDADPDGLIGSPQHEEVAPEKFSKRACQLLFEIEKAKRQKKRNRGSVESLQVEFFFNNNLPERNYESVDVALEFLRRSNLLEIIMDYFLAVLRKSIKFRNLNLSRPWLLQLQRLIKFYRSYGSELLAKDYESSIQLLEDSLQELQSSYGTVDFEANDVEVPEFSLNEGNTAIKPSAEVNPYEEVIPMKEDMPTIQSAMRMWESKLQKKHTESLRSSKSTRGSKRSAKIKDIQVEVHKGTETNVKGEVAAEHYANKYLNENEDRETASNESSENELEMSTRKSSKSTGSAWDERLSNTSMNLNIDQDKTELVKKFPMNSSSFSDEIYKCKADDMANLSFSTAYETKSDSLFSVKFDSDSVGLAEFSSFKKAASIVDLTDNDSLVQISAKDKDRCIKLSKNKKSKNSTKSNDLQRLSDERNSYNKNSEHEISSSTDIAQSKTAKQQQLSSKNQKILKNKHHGSQTKSRRTNRKKSAKHKTENAESLNTDSDQSEGADSKRISNQKVCKTQKEKPSTKFNKAVARKHDENKLTGAYDNQAYCTDSTDQIHESINLGLKIMKRSTKTKASQKPTLDEKSKPRNIKSTADTFSAKDSSSSFSKKFGGKSDIISPRLSIRSQASFKENRCITYETDSDENIETQQQSTSEAEEELFEFKCLDDISLDNLQEFETLGKEKSFKHDIEHPIDPTGLFAYNVVNEKLSKCSSDESADYSTDELESKQKTLSQGIELRNMGREASEENLQDDEKESKIAKNEDSSKKSFFSKYINRENVLKKLTIISPDMIDTLAESKQKIKDSLSEDKRAHVRNVLKKRTVQLKQAVLK